MTNSTEQEINPVSGEEHSTGVDINRAAKLAAGIVDLGPSLLGSYDLNDGKSQSRVTVSERHGSLKVSEGKSVEPSEQTKRDADERSEYASEGWGDYGWARATSKTATSVKPTRDGGYKLKVRTAKTERSASIPVPFTRQRGKSVVRMSRFGDIVRNKGVKLSHSAVTDILANTQGKLEAVKTEKEKLEAVERARILRAFK